jgi:OPT oligopeptide transporter protein
MILPSKTIVSMLLGAILGCGILSPIAKSHGWAPGATDDWSNESRGWTIWVSLGLILGDSVVNITWLIIRPAVKTIIYSLCHGISPQDPGEQRGSYGTLSSSWESSDDGLLPTGNIDNESSVFSNNDSVIEARRRDSVSLHNDNRPLISSVSPATLFSWLLGSQMICFATVWLAFGDIVPSHAIVLAIILGTLLSFITIRSEGETGATQADTISRIHFVDRWNGSH